MHPENGGSFPCQFLESKALPADPSFWGASVGGCKGNQPVWRSESNFLSKIRDTEFGLFVPRGHGDDLNPPFVEEWEWEDVWFPVLVQGGKAERCFESCVDRMDHEFNESA